MHRREGNPLHICLKALRTESHWEGNPFPMCFVRQIVSCQLVVLKLECTSESPGGLVVTQVTGPLPRVSDSLGLGRGPRIGISNKFPGVMLMLLVHGPHFEN